MMTHAEWLKTNSNPDLWAHVEPHLEGLQVFRAFPLSWTSATPGERKIFLCPVVGLITLVTAFHEIGHTKTWKLGIEDRMWHEDAAWEWARNNCPVWNRRTQKYAYHCRRSYEHYGKLLGCIAEHEYQKLIVNELKDAGFSPDQIGPIPPRPKV